MELIHKFVPGQGEGADTTLVLLHGTGGNEDDLVGLGKFLAPNAALLGVRGNVTEAGAPRFFRRLAEGVFDEEDLIFRTHELARFLRQATTTYNLNPHRLVAVGYSNGANIAASLLLLEPNILSGAVLLRAMVPLVPEELPQLGGIKVLMQSGLGDPLIPADNSARLSELLISCGADVTLNWQQTGHGLANAEVQVAQEWLSKEILSV